MTPKKTKYKVEVKAGSAWVPACHKYFQDRSKAVEFQNRFANQHLKGQKRLTRIKTTGKQKKYFDDIFMPFCGILLMYSWTFSCFCAVVAL